MRGMASNMGMGMGMGMRRGAASIFALVLLTVACGGAPAAPSASSGSKPIVVIQAPANGSQVALGQDVTVSGSASDTVGVDHVALFVDGVSFATTPTGQPAPLSPFSLNWLASPAGSHTLQAIAYRTDGTASDPAVITLTVGAGSGSPGASSGVSMPPLPIVTPAPTKKPKPPKPPTMPPTTPPTSPPSTTPTETPTSTPTPPPSPVLTPATDGTAPGDSSTEPHEILVNVDCRTSGLCSTDVPAAALGSIQEQISAPNGDNADELFFRPLANTFYKVQMTSCSDTSDVTGWMSPGGDPSLITGCGDWLVDQVGDTPPAMITIDVKFNAPSAQTYNLYTFVVVQCAFTNCGTS